MGAHDHLPAPPVVSPPESSSSASTRQIKLKSSQILRRVETTCEHLATLAEELHSQPPSTGGADPRRAVLSAQYEQLEQQLRQMQAEAAQYEERRHAQQLVSERNDRIREVATVREELCEEQEKHARAVEEGREARELLARGEKERGWLLEAKRAAEWQVEALVSELSLTSADMSALCEERAGERGREGALARLHARVVMQRSLALSFGWWAVRVRARERLASKQAIAALRHAWPRVGGCFKRWVERWKGEGRMRRLLRRSADRLGRPRLLACWGRWQRDWELSEVKEVLRAREGWWAQMQEENASLRSSLTREADGKEARARFRQAVDQREGRIRELQAMLEREHAARLRAEERQRRQQERAEAYEEELREYEAELDMARHSSLLLLLPFSLLTLFSSPSRSNKRSAPCIEVNLCWQVSQEADLGIFRARAASPASINSQSPPH
ncbi:MAG: hypothetical protein SGPRY_011110 [Prymnesium sp.]